jgi:hypothetical protein
MFIRLVVGHDREHHRSLTGIVTEARLLGDQGGLEQGEADRLEDVYEWLNSNLPLPPFSSSGWSREAVTWFKDSAGEPLRKLWEIASILKANGVPVRLLRSRNPGKVLYEDQFQVVVEEWRKL